MLTLAVTGGLKLGLNRSETFLPILNVSIGDATF